MALTREQEESLAHMRLERKVAYGLRGLAAGAPSLPDMEDERQLMLRGEPVFSTRYVLGDEEFLPDGYRGNMSAPLRISLAKYENDPDYVVRNVGPVRERTSFLLYACGSGQTETAAMIDALNDLRSKARALYADPATPDGEMSELLRERDNLFRSHFNDFEKFLHG